MKKRLLIIGPTYQQARNWMSYIDGSQWSDITIVSQGHEVLGWDPLTTFVVKLEGYKNHPEWPQIEPHVRVLEGMA
jgi:hypothetical protein